MFKYLLGLMILFPILVKGQSFDLGSWNILNVKYNYNDRWSAFGELQLRSLKFYDNFHYHENKGGLTYKLHKNVTLSLGAGSYQTYREGGDFVLPKNNDEFRLWPQLVVTQSIGILKVEQRYSTESRFTSFGYRNRFRSRIGVSLPLGKEVNGFSPYHINASNELFFTDREPYFERNRIQLVFNYKITKNSTVQIGYLHQFDYRINDETGNDFLVVGFYHELFRRWDKEPAQNNELIDN